MSTGTGQIRLAARERDVVHPMEGQEGLTVSAVVLAPDDAALVRVHDVPGGVDEGVKVVGCGSDHHLHRIVWSNELLFDCNGTMVDAVLEAIRVRVL